MEYYKNNAIYDYLIREKISEFKFVSGNVAQLIYGDRNSNPLLLIFNLGVESNKINDKPDSVDIEAFNLLKFIAEKSKLPLICVRFACDITIVESVKISYDLIEFKDYTMAELTDLYVGYGLPISKTKTAKYLNDKTSSAYHNWQRDNLGAELTVSDIDLIQLNKDGCPKTICELKRSYYELERWQPFEDDYKNFILVYNLCCKSGINFKIIYNQRIKVPFQDKIDRLKIFTVDFSKKPSIIENGIINLEEIINL